MKSLVEEWPEVSEAEAKLEEAPRQPLPLVGLRGKEEFLVLPSGPITITESAQGIFSSIAPTNSLFYREGVVEVTTGSDGCLSLRPVTPAAFCSRIEGYGKRVGAWRADRDDKFALKLARCSVDNAVRLLASLEAEKYLPRIHTITAAPILTEENGEIVTIGQGYHAANGGILVAGGNMPPEVEVADARRALLDLLQDFDFPTPGDYARAVASLLSPCLKFGRLLGEADFPLDVAEAKASQSGKTYRQKVVAAIYGERAHVVNMRHGGVGSLDESISAAMLSGRPFISIDNVRGRVDSQIIESALRGHGYLDVRAVRRASVQVSTGSFLWQLSSNGAEMTRDLANRSIITRVQKREAGYRFKEWPEGALVEHIRANQSFYLGCVFAIVKQWLARGKPMTGETRHDFREWVRALDWICQKVMCTAPILDGHDIEQERVGNPALVWLREVALQVQAEGEEGVEIFASRIAEICSTAGILYPGGKSEPDDEKAKRHVGRIMAKLFGESDDINIDGFSVQRIRREKQDEKYRTIEERRYVFKEARA